MNIGVRPNNSHNNYNYNSYRTSLPKYIFISIIIVLAFVFIYFLISFLTKPKSVISENMYIENINLTGKSKDEAMSLLKDNFNYLNEDKANFKIAETKFTLTAKELEYYLDLESGVDEAFNISKENKFKPLKEKQNISLKANFNKDKMDTYIKEILKLIPKSLEEKDLIKVEDNNLIIYKGDDPVKITEEELQSIILKKFKSSNFKQIEEIPLTSSYKNNINFDEIYKKIEKSPKDAYVDRNGKVIPEENGVKLKYSKEDAEKMYMDAKEKCIIPIEIIYAKVKSSDLNKDKFQDKLTQVSLPLPKNPIEKQNILYKAKLFNNLIIKNNNNFSYNNIQDSSKTDADIFVSSIIYRAAISLGLDISEVHKNKYLPEYILDGLDSYVDSSKNLSFRNNLPDPIIFKVSNNNDKLFLSIYGNKLGLNTVINFTYKVLETIPFKKEVNKNFHYNIGYEDIKQKGIDGKIIEVYKEIIINGKSSGKTKFGTFKYDMQKEIKDVGNKPSSEN